MSLFLSHISQTVRWRNQQPRNNKTINEKAPNKVGSFNTKGEEKSSLEKTEKFDTITPYSRQKPQKNL